MKRALMYLFILFLASKAWGDNYLVNVTSELNVRSEPSTEGLIIDKLKNKDVVEATILDNGWAKVTINGKIGYVNSQYLKKDTSNTVVKKRKTRWESKFDWGDENYKWMIYLIAGFILAIWFLCKFIRKLGINDYFWETANLKGGLAILSASLQIACSFLIFFYVWKAGQYALWFIMPSNVGWGYVILNFIFFLYALINLFVGFLKTMDDIQVAYHANIHLKWGMITWGIGLIVILFCYFYKEEYFKTTFLILLACQIIQIVIITVNLWKKGGIRSVLIASFTYMICSTAIVVFVAPLVVITIALLVMGIIFYIVFFKMAIPTPTSFTGGGGIPVSGFGGSSNESQSEDKTEPEYDYVLKGKGNLGDDLMAKKLDHETLLDENNKIWKKNRNGDFEMQD